MKSRSATSIELGLHRIKVVSDKVRWKVIELLIEGPKTVGELAMGLGIEQSLLSHHLKILRQAGLIKSRREGKSVRCELTEVIVVSDSGWELDLGCCRLQKATGAPFPPIACPPPEPLALENRIQGRSSVGNEKFPEVVSDEVT